MTSPTIRNVGTVVASLSVPRPRLTLRVFSLVDIHEYMHATSTSIQLTLRGTSSHKLKIWRGQKEVRLRMVYGRTFTEHEVEAHENEVVWHKVVLRSNREIIIESMHQVMDLPESASSD